jgi:hypothetical protein
VDLDWSERRRQAARAHEAALRSAQAREHESARALIDRFVAGVKELGVAPQRLTAAGYSGGRYKTDVVGWYLRRNQSLGVDTDGNYYVLQTPGGVLARFRGVRLTPGEPPLTVGRGARDGESIDLADLVESRLSELGGVELGGPELGGRGQWEKPAGEV